MKKEKEFIKIEGDFDGEIVSIITYQEGYIVATKNSIYTNVKSLIKNVKAK